MNSLRWKLIVGILTGITFALALGGTFAFVKIKKRLYADFDQSLFQRAVALKSPHPSTTSRRHADIIARLAGHLPSPPQRP